MSTIIHAQYTSEYVVDTDGRVFKNGVFEGQYRTMAQARIAVEKLEQYDRELVRKAGQARHQH